MIETGVRTVMITTRTVPAPSPTTACRRSSAPTHRDFADHLRTVLRGREGEAPSRYSPGPGRGTTAAVDHVGGVLIRSLAWHLRGFEGNTAAPITRQSYRVTALRADGGLTVAPIVERGDAEGNVWGERAWVDRVSASQRRDFVAWAGMRRSPVRRGLGTTIGPSPSVPGHISMVRALPGIVANVRIGRGRLPGAVQPWCRG